MEITCNFVSKKKFNSKKIVTTVYLIYIIHYYSKTKQTYNRERFV